MAISSFVERNPKNKWTSSSRRIRDVCIMAFLFLVVYNGIGQEGSAVSNMLSMPNEVMNQQTTKSNKSKPARVQHQKEDSTIVAKQKQPNEDGKQKEEEIVVKRQERKEQTEQKNAAKAEMKEEGQAQLREVKEVLKQKGNNGQEQDLIERQEQQTFLDHEKPIEERKVTDNDKKKAIDEKKATSVVDKKKAVKRDEARAEAINKTAIHSPLFASFPHRLVGLGRHLSCEWKTRDSMTKEDIHQLSVDLKEMDEIQKKILREGVCVPNDKKLQLRLFSSVDAQECLATKTIIFAANEQLADMFAGLADVLLSGVFNTMRPSEIAKALLKKKEKDPLFPDLQWACERDCDGTTVPWMYLCSTCLNEVQQEAVLQYSEEDPNSVVVVLRGSYAQFKLSAYSEERTVHELYLLQQVVQRSLMMSFPIKPTSRVKYRRIGPEDVYWQYMKLVGRHPLELPYVDVVQAERVCIWENCTAKAGRANAPFVNRWKAQLLLNSLCNGGYPYSHPGNNTEGELSSKFIDSALPEYSEQGLSPNELTEKNNSTVVKKNEPSTDAKSANIQFVPFPHRDIGVGDAAACEWKYQDINNPKHPVVASLLGRDVGNPDSLQRQALSETVCVPKDLNKPVKLHLFSIAEARKCLSNVTLAVGGDSYARNMFIEIGSTLFGRTTNVEIYGGRTRKNLLDVMNEEIRNYRRQWDTTFPDVRWVCHYECYGMQQPFATVCAECLEEFRKTNPKKEIVTFIGAGVHVHSHHKHDVPKTMRDIHRFWNLTSRTIFSTLINYENEKVPEQYQDIKASHTKTQVYFQQLADYKRYDSIRLFDYFQFTLACRMDNCTKDGGHRTRFVNRWKVQLLLNMLCRYS